VVDLLVFVGVSLIGLLIVDKGILVGDNVETIVGCRLKRFTGRFWHPITKKIPRIRIATFFIYSLPGKFLENNWTNLKYLISLHHIIQFYLILGQCLRQRYTT
jgi:hypothetical protein